MKPSAAPASTRHGAAARTAALPGCAALVAVWLFGCAIEPRLELEPHAAREALQEAEPPQVLETPVVVEHTAEPDPLPSLSEPAVRPSRPAHQGARRASRSVRAPREQVAPEARAAPPAADVPAACVQPPAPAMEGAPCEAQLLLAALRAARMSYDVPRVMRQGESIRLVLVLDARHTAGPLEGAAAAFDAGPARHITARLEGGGAFDIDPAEREEQALRAEAANRWAWTVRPAHAGAGRLSLEIVLMPDAPAGASAEPLVVRSISDAVRIEPDTWARLQALPASLSTLHAAMAALTGSLCALTLGLRRSAWRTSARRRSPPPVANTTTA